MLPKFHPLSRNKRVLYFAQKVFLFFWLFLVAGCDPVYTLSEPVAEPYTLAEFNQSPGYKLDYDLYMPSQLNHWVHDASSKFVYDQTQRTYWIKNIYLGDDLDKRALIDFKISNIDWHHQFGFSETRINQDESVYSVPAEKQIVLRLSHSQNTSNLTLELPKNSDARYVSLAVKVTDNSLQPDALLFTRLSSQRIE